VGYARPQLRGATLEEIERVYRERLDELCSVAAAILGDRQQARDVVHDAFASIVRRRRTFRRSGPLDAWIWRSVVNAALTHRRRLAEAASPTAAVAAGNGDGPSANGDLHAAVAALPERQRVALFLRYYADLDYDAIGEVLGVRDGTVAATLHAARTALRRTLEEVQDVRR
jgi:RNA polymerase sigma factor (sigma-70 family)